jgi:hypothetical protein
MGIQVIEFYGEERARSIDLGITSANPLELSGILPRLLFAPTSTLLAEYQNAHKGMCQRQHCDDFHQRLIHELVVIGTGCARLRSRLSPTP